MTIKENKAYSLIRKFDKWLKEQPTGKGDTAEDFMLEKVREKWEEFKGGEIDGT